MKTTTHDHRGKAQALLARSGYGKHPDAAADKALVRKMVEPSALKRARGGHVREGKKSTVNILIAPGSHDDPGRPPMGAPPMAMPAAPRAPVAPRPMGAPGMGGAPPMMARGGPAMDAGAGGAKGRMEKVKAYGKRG